jgi:hypothetical protein
VVFYLEERMRTRATFFETSRGLLNFGLVKLIDTKTDPETVRFIFDDARGAFIALPRKGSRNSAAANAERDADCGIKKTRWELRAQTTGHLVLTMMTTET